MRYEVKYWNPTAVLFSILVQTPQTRNHHGMSMQIILGDCNVTSAGGAGSNPAALSLVHCRQLPV